MQIGSTNANRQHVSYSPPNLCPMQASLLACNMCPTEPGHSLRRLLNTALQEDTITRSEYVHEMTPKLALP